MLVLASADFLWFIDQALDGIEEIITRAGDTLANARPDVPGSNTLYALLTHCLGVMAYWGGHLVAGRPIDRDREGEFVAQGPVAELLERARQARAQLNEDVMRAEPLAPLRMPGEPEDAHLPFGRTQAGALLHVFEELRLHLGHMQLTLDMLLAQAGDPQPG